MTEEPNMINTTLNNGRSLRQLIIGVSLFLAFQAIRKSLEYVKIQTNNKSRFVISCISSPLDLTDAIITIPDTGTSMKQILICC